MHILVCLFVMTKCWKYLNFNCSKSRQCFCMSTQFVAISSNLILVGSGPISWLFLSRVSCIKACERFFFIPFLATYAEVFECLWRFQFLAAAFYSAYVHFKLFRLFLKEVGWIDQFNKENFATLSTYWQRFIITSCNFFEKGNWVLY